jgi:hypothetical protein
MACHAHPWSPKLAGPAARKLSYKNDLFSEESISDILDRIGFKTKSSQGMEVEASQVSTQYPEPPEISMSFGDLLKKCNYTDEVLAEVLEQYSAVLDITVCCPCLRSPLRFKHALLNDWLGTGQWADYKCHAVLAGASAHLAQPLTLMPAMRSSSSMVRGARIVIKL